jgi:Ser/Thr protein kinase RdoA (MazF antagonist)
VGRILREYRLSGIDPVAVRRLYGSVSGTRVGYLLTLPAGARVVVRAFRSDEPLAAHLQGCGTASVADWLYGRAATLDWLAERGYPAPRVVATRTGEPVGVAGIWLTWATSYVAGAPLAPGGGELFLLGEALGRLHALAMVPGSGAAPRSGAAPGSGVGAGLAVGRGGGVGASRGRASWHPQAAVPAALRRLDAVETLLPGDWRPLHEGFRRTLLTLRDVAGTLPMTVVHGDPWPGNAIRTGDAEVTLIHWENCGLGFAVADLGHCLLECHLDPGLPAGQPTAWLIRPDESRLAAVLAGYSRLRRLDSSERECLLPGIRLATALMGALHFEQALIDGVRGAGMDARLGRLRNRLEVSQAVAELASRHLGEPASRYAEPGPPVAGGTGA